VRVRPRFEVTGHGGNVRRAGRASFNFTIHRLAHSKWRRDDRAFARSLTQSHLRELKFEFCVSDPKQDVLGWELHNGALWLLQKVRWRVAS
jgi:hypothetical protein